MDMMEYFLDLPGHWAIAPISVAEALARRNPALSLSELREGPPDRVVYYLTGKERRRSVGQLLAILDRRLRERAGIESYLDGGLS